MKLSQNEATRIVSIIDNRIRRALGRGTVLEHTYGEVYQVQTSAHTCSVYIGGDTNPSEGFRIPAGMRILGGDRVRVAIDPRGDRWVEEQILATTWPTMLFDPIRGALYTGSGASDPHLTIYTDGWAEGGINTDWPLYVGQDSMVDADLEVSGSLTVDNGFILAKYPGVWVPVAQSSGSLTNGAFYTLSFTTEPAGTRDGHGMHFSFDPTKFYIQPTPGSGLWEVDVAVDWGNVASSSGRGILNVYKNGSTWLGSTDMNIIAGTQRHVHHHVVDLTVGDYLELELENQTGVTRTATINWVSIKKVSD